MSEAEEAFSGFTVNLDSYSVDQEQRYEDLGMTLAGRLLKLISTDRDDLVRIVTAMDAAPSLHRLYWRKVRI